ncbi:MAG: DUF5009 domain-containing protein [Planctomycetaceae bacterium]
MNSKSSDRLISVDAFRGLVMARMLVGLPLIPAVQTLPGGWFRDIVETQLFHSTWNGITWVDFSLAGFIMLMGLSVRLSLKQYKDGSRSSSEFYLKVISRTLTLILLGFLYNGGFSEPWPDIRLAGVLQRMGICYLISAFIYLYTSVNQRTCILILILMSYWAILHFYPGHNGEIGVMSLQNNAAKWIDSRFLPGKLFYGTWDPEGILTTLPAVGSAIIGMLWGDILYSEKGLSEKVIYFIVWGLIAINLGYIWDYALPINKPLWTSSYVVLTSGIGALMFAACFVLGEVYHCNRLLFPFVVIGRNLLITFMMIRYVPFDEYAHLLTGGDVSLLLGAFAPFAMAMTEILLLWGILLFLYRNNLVFRV